jgi:hypothetical protein
MQDRIPQRPIHMVPNEFWAVCRVACLQGKMAALDDCVRLLPFAVMPVVWGGKHVILMGQRVPYVGLWPR